MAANEPKQPSRQRVVEMVKASRTWRGAYQADYNCPKCRSPLMSLDDTLLSTETCPNCNVAFVFGPTVQADYRTHKAAIERKEAEKQRAAEQRKQLADERSRAAEVGNRRHDEEEREYSRQSKLEKKAIERERMQKIAARRSNVSGVEALINTVGTLAFIGSMIMVALGISGLASNNGVAGLALVVSGMVSLVSLLLVWGLFGCLFAIHQLLADISAKLDQESRDG